MGGEWEVRPRLVVGWRGEVGAEVSSMQCLQDVGGAEASSS